MAVLLVAVFVGVFVLVMVIVGVAMFMPMFAMAHGATSKGKKKNFSEDSHSRRAWQGVVATLCLG